MKLHRLSSMVSTFTVPPNFVSSALMVVCDFFCDMTRAPHANGEEQSLAASSMNA